MDSPALSIPYVALFSISFSYAKHTRCANSTDSTTSYCPGCGWRLKRPKTFPEKNKMKRGGIMNTPSGGRTSAEQHTKGTHAFPPKTWFGMRQLLHVSWQVSRHGYRTGPWYFAVPRIHTTAGPSRYPIAEIATANPGSPQTEKYFLFVLFGLARLRIPHKGNCLTAQLRLCVESARNTPWV